METAFHYLVRIKLIRYKSPDEVEFFVVEEKKFENQNPILAREAAFNWYQNYIDVLLQSKGIEYYSDKQAREYLESFFKDDISGKIRIENIEIVNGFEINKLLSYGIGIFLVVDIPKDEKHDVFKHKKEDEFLIHGIGVGSIFSYDTENIVWNLDSELDYYQHFKYETRNSERDIVYCDRDEWEEGYRDSEPGSYRILETPFDWTGYDKPYWWGNAEEQETNVEETISLDEIIERGEGKQIEFKPGLINWPNSTRNIEYEVAKTICAFLNAEGGILIIGIADKSSKVIGINFDKISKDEFLREFTRIKCHYLPPFIAHKINGEFREIESKEIFLIAVEPCKLEPIFLYNKKDNNNTLTKEFYVRSDAGSRHIYDIEQVIKYCREHWK